jgi:hypothetical protein
MGGGGNVNEFYLATVVLSLRLKIFVHSCGFHPQTSYVSKSQKLKVMILVIQLKVVHDQTYPNMLQEKKKDAILNLSETVSDSIDSDSKGSSAAISFRFAKKKSLIQSRSE